MVAQKQRIVVGVRGNELGTFVRELASLGLSEEPKRKDTGQGTEDVGINIIHSMHVKRFSVIGSDNRDAKIEWKCSVDATCSPLLEAALSSGQTTDEIVQVDAFIRTDHPVGFLLKTAFNKMATDRIGAESMGSKRTEIQNGSRRELLITPDTESMYKAFDAIRGVGDWIAQTYSSIDLDEVHSYVDAVEWVDRLSKIRAGRDFLLPQEKLEGTGSATIIQWARRENIHTPSVREWFDAGIAYYEGHTQMIDTAIEEIRNNREIRTILEYYTALKE